MSEGPTRHGLRVVSAADEPAEPGQEAEPRERRSRRWLLWVGLGVLLLGVLLAGVGIAALSARRDLTQAEAALQRGREELLDGEVEAARAEFERAREGFASATEVATGPWFRVVGWIPILGRTSDAVAAIADAGEQVAGTGATLAGTVAELPGGLASLAPSGGRVPIEGLGPIANAVADARDETALALATISRAPRSWLIGPVGGARVEAEEELGSLLQTFRDGAQVLEGLPAFLGAEEPKRYFFGAQNPAELRGTGGVMGAYSILTIDDGRFDFSGFEPVQTLPIPKLSEVPPPTAEFAVNYNAFRGEGRFWLAINLTPDFPTAAEAIVNAYEVAEGERLDGVIMADPFALRALLEVTGPAYVPGLDATVGAQEVVDFVANEAYGVYPDAATRKRVLGAVAEAVVAEFVSRTGTDVADLRTLARSAAEGHILVYSEDPLMQEGLAGTGAGGALPTGPGDLLAIVENSSGGNKVDYYQGREVTYTVDLWPDGAGEAVVDVELTNGAPTSGQPRYVIGPYPGYSEAGEGGQLLSVFCGEGCALQGARRDGSPIEVWAGRELGHPFFQDYFRTPSGATSDLAMTLYLPDAWEGDATGGTYRLTFLNQTTIRPTSLLVEVHAPDGMRIVNTSPQMSVEGGTAIWEGTPKRRLELEVTFQPPLIVRLWKALTT